MRRFRVSLRGRDFVLTLDRERQRLGFHTTRVVEAASAAEARERALALLAEHAAVARPTNGPEDPAPVVLVDAVEPLPWWARVPARQPGLAFYPEDASETAERPLA